MRKLSWTAQDILTVLKQNAPKYLSPTQLTEKLDNRYKRNTIQKSLQRMEENELVIHDAHGAWRYLNKESEAA